jgi:hypothetical protein
MYEVTPVGAPGREYVSACALGISRDTNNAVAVANAPKPVIFRDVRVCFILLSNQRSISISRSFGNDMVANR